MSEQYTEREDFGTYGGSDTIWLINGEMIGELQGIRFNEHTKEIEIGFVNFTQDLKGSKEPKESRLEWLKDVRNITVEQLSLAGKSKVYSKDEEPDYQYVEEPFNKRYRRFTGLNYLYEKGEAAIDMVMEETIYVFSYDKASKQYDVPLSVTLENMTEYMDKYIK